MVSEIPDKLLAIDPGKTSGWAFFIEGKLATFGNVQEEKFAHWYLGELERLRPTVVLYENYRVRPPKPGTRYTPWWSSPVALELIGIIKAIAQARDIRFEKQEPTILPVGSGYLGIPYTKGKHLDNHLAAMAHGAYFLVKSCGMSPAELRRLQAGVV